MMRRISGLSEIAADFDGMIIDQFGVIHDGRRLYPGTLEVMARLAEAGVKVVIVTNSGKRSAANVKRIVKMGVPRAQFIDCISSGEIAYQALKVKRAYIIGRHGDDYEFEGIQSVDDPRDAEVLLILGTNVPETSLEDYRAMLKGVTLPCICCNPDRWMLTPQGLQPAPGAIAALYEELGGKVTWIGKPYPQIYQAALKAMGNPKRVLCIGDSAEHDVAGGRNAGLSTLLVQQGVSEGLKDEAINPSPDFLLERFLWAVPPHR
jgi:HAD superfamily hydrolase (TIGR01459 family)